VTLEASQWTRGASTAPAIVLVHRLAGSRAEWGGLIPELFASPGDLTVLALDLRGHGGSRQKDPTGKLSGWRELGASDYAAMGDDVLAAVAHLRQGGVTRPVALVGSDLGATAVCLAGGKVGAGLAGIALVSPGGALRGVDLFEPFAQLKSHPVWLAVGQEDAVSLAATRTLEKMSPTAKLLVLPSSAHGAEALGAERPELWRSLAEFLRALKS